MGAVKKVIILHGWIHSVKGVNPLEKWQPFLNLLKKNDISYEIPNIPGITTQINEVWTLKKYIEWLKKRVKEKVVLIGHSNGGRIAFSFAEKYPELVDKLILIDSAGIYHNELSLKIKRFFFRKVAKIGKKFTESEALRKLVYKIAREGDYSNATVAQRQTMVNLINQDLTGIIKQVKIPTLIIWGEEDKVTPLTDGKLMSSLIEGSKLKIITEARHSPQFTNPKEVAKIINEYL